jgi:hypothetical protein
MKKGVGNDTEPPVFILARSAGLEPAASGVTGRRYNQLNYDPVCNLFPVETRFLSSPWSKPGQL